MGNISAIVLAAGKSTRMKSDLPKVLHEVCGRTMLSFVLNACRLAGVERLFVVVGHGRDLVRECHSGDTDLVWVDQKEQLGTGHAVLCCERAMADVTGSVLVVAGDMPLVHRETLANLIQAREQNGDALTMATTVLEDPRGYGRILRDEDGRLCGIVEDRDCGDAERSIREVNPSYYCFDGREMFAALAQVRPFGAKGEYYLTDTVRVLRTAGKSISASVSLPPEDAVGINSRLDLATVSRYMQDRIQLSIMEEGVTIHDPDTTWIEADVTIGRDTLIYPFTFIGAGACIGSGCRIGPYAHIARDEVVSDGALIGRGICNGAAVA